MKPTIAQMIAVAAESEGVSESEIARRLGMTPSGLNNCKHGLAAMRPVQFCKLAEMGGVRSADVIFEALEAFEKKEADKAFWRGKLKALFPTSAGQAALLLSVGLGLLALNGSPAEAAELQLQGAKLLGALDGQMFSNSVNFAEYWLKGPNTVIVGHIALNLLGFLLGFISVPPCVQITDRLAACVLRHF